MKFHYTAYGIPIESNMELPALNPSVPDTSIYKNSHLQSITIALEKVPQKLREDPLGYNEYGMFNPNESIINIKDTAAFYVCDGSSISVQPFTDDLNSVNQQIYSNCLTIALLQRGIVLFHCSGIFIGEGEVVLFAAPKATGKSTLSLMLQQMGYTPFTDDTTAFSFRDGECFADASYPVLRLDDHSISRQNLYSSKEMTYRAADGKSAFYYHHKFKAGKVKIKGIVFLECKGKEMLISHLAASESIQLLAANIYRRDWLRELRMERLEVDFIGNCAAIPMWKAARPVCSDTYSSFAEMIEKQIINKILASKL